MLVSERMRPLAWKKKIERGKKRKEEKNEYHH
jgi:hypothetical protein